MKNICEECSHVRCEILRPFVRVYPFVLDKPLSKKMPKGILSNRNGLSSIEVFCNEVQAMNQSWPVCADYDFSLAFELRNRLFNQ